MPGRSFITSRKGKLSNFCICRYGFAEGLSRAHKAKLCQWLYSNADVQLLEIKPNFFYTLKPLSAEKTTQYKYEGLESICFPFDNTSYISTILSRIICTYYKREYRQYLNKNAFQLTAVTLSPFTLWKCFEFNIEIFSDGSFFVHFFPVSKILGENNTDEEYLKRLKEGFEARNVDDMVFSVVDQRSFKRCKFNLLDSDLAEKVTSFIRSGSSAVSTFDYHFLASYKPEIFGEFTKQAERVLSTAVSELRSISGKLPEVPFILWHTKPFFEINVAPLLLQNNLLVGNNMKVNQQKAAFYQGMYRPVDDIVIQPVAIDGIETREFKKLVNEHFNKNGTAEVYEPIKLSSNEKINIEIFKNLKNKFGKDIVFPVFTKYQLPKDYLDSFMDLKVKYQIYSGEVDLHQLSNFTVKCLEKAGGLLSAVNNLYEPDTTYFLGFDMGHTTHNNDEFTNLCMVLFDNHGCFLRHWLIEKMPRNEALNPEAISRCFNKMKSHLYKIRYPLPKKFIIHRDGKVHEHDVEILVSQSKLYFDTEVIDVVEVIKSGYPVIACHLNGKFMNLNSGEYWSYEEKNYAILVTNIQADRNGEMLNPIIIKQKYGATPFTNLVEQLYWFTKIYTNNLYNSTRLPATTEKANNYVSTSSKKHSSSYLA